MFNKPAKDTDDFEKEALEGFSLLENEDTAFELKEELDAKIYPGLFSEKKGSRTVYWLAIASMLIIVGFSVYFIIDHPVSAPKDVAVVTTPAVKDKVPEIIAPQSPEPLATSPPPAQKTAKKSVPAMQMVPPLTVPVLSDANPVSEAVVTDEKKQIRATEKTEDVALAGGGSNEVQAPMESAQFENAGAAEDSRERKAAPARKTKSEQQEKAYSMTARSQPSEEMPVSVTYRGGIPALKKDVDSLLVPEKLNRQFDAVFYINKKNGVTSVEITDAHGLSKTEQKKIRGLLGTLNRFYFNPGGKSSEDVTFTLHYIP